MCIGEITPGLQCCLYWFTAHLLYIYLHGLMTICQCTSMDMTLFVAPKCMVFDMALCSALCFAFHYTVHWGVIHNEMNYKSSKYDRCVNVAMHITEMHNCEWALKDFKWIHNYLKTSNRMRNVWTLKRIMLLAEAIWVYWISAKTAHNNISQSLICSSPYTVALYI